MMRTFFLLLFIITISDVVIAQQSEEDFDDIVCKEAEAHAHLFQSRTSTNPLTENYDLKYYRFEWDLDPAQYFIQGSATAYFQILENNFTEIHFDLSSQLLVSNVKYHHLNIPFTQSGDYVLTIDLPGDLNAGMLDSVTISYSGAPPSNGFGSFEQDNHNGVPILWTLSEPYGSQDWWPCKNGLTDKIDSVDVIITTPIGNRAASNGVLVSEVTSGSDKIYHWKHRYPITPYLVAICVTNFVEYSDTVLLGNGTALPMVNYVYPEGLAAAQTGTADLIQVLQYFDSLFVTYPFYEEKYGHAQWGWGGGEEHQTMSFVSSFGWTLLSHELAHQWFGDMVTCGSWEDIWLNEGFATYLEALSRERFLGNDSWNAWKSSRVNTITSQPNGSVKVTDTTSVNRIFSGRLSYSKGAYLLHMLRWKLGEQDFYQGIRDYLNDNQFDYAKTSDLQRHLETSSGLDLTEFFDDWFVGQGHPSYSVTWDQHDSELLIQLSQVTSDLSVDFFEMPVPLRLSGNGVDTMIRLEHTHDDQLFSVPVSFEVVSVEFDPDIWLISRDNMVQQGMLVSSSQPLSENLALVVFPNPATDKLHASLEGFTSDHELRWEIINMLGQRMDVGILSDTHAIFDLQRLTPGIYQLVISENGGGINCITFVRE